MGINDTVLSRILTGEESVYSDHDGVFYDPKQDILCGKHKGMRLEEPASGFRERFAKLKARGELLDSVADRLRAREFEVYSEVGRLLDEREALAEIAKSLGLDTLAAHALPAQVLAMNTELTAALAKAEAKRDEAIAEATNECKGRAAAEAEARDLTSALCSQMDDTRAAKAEIEALRSKLAEAAVRRIMAEATAAGMRTALQHLERAMREKLRP